MMVPVLEIQPQSVASLNNSSSIFDQAELVIIKFVQHPYAQRLLNGMGSIAVGTLDRVNDVQHVWPFHPIGQDWTICNFD